MKEILFGMAVGGILGIMLYKNNDCTKNLIDEGEKLIKKEIKKAEKSQKSSPQAKPE